MASSNATPRPSPPASPISCRPLCRRQNSSNPLLVDSAAGQPQALPLGVPPRAPPPLAPPQPVAADLASHVHPRGPRSLGVPSQLVAASASRSSAVNEPPPSEPIPEGVWVPSRSGHEEAHKVNRRVHERNEKRKASTMDVDVLLGWEHRHRHKSASSAFITRPTGPISIVVRPPGHPPPPHLVTVDAKRLRLMSASGASNVAQT